MKQYEKTGDVYVDKNLTYPHKHPGVQILCADKKKVVVLSMAFGSEIVIQRKLFEKVYIKKET
jgi:hypothetical protein